MKSLLELVGVQAIKGSLRFEEPTRRQWRAGDHEAFVHGQRTFLRNPAPKDLPGARALANAYPASGQRGQFLAGMHWEHLDMVDARNALRGVGPQAGDYRPRSARF